MAQATSTLWGPSEASVNAGAGPHFDVLEVGHADYVALINADTAFWMLSPRAEALDYLLGAELPRAFREKEAKLTADLNTVRFGLLPSAVYFLRHLSKKILQGALGYMEFQKIHLVFYHFRYSSRRIFEY